MFLSRVKELGPGAPIEGKMIDVTVYDDELVPQQNSDLAMLRSANVSWIHKILCFQEYL